MPTVHPQGNRGWGRRKPPQKRGAMYALGIEGIGGYESQDGSAPRVPERRFDPELLGQLDAAHERIRARFGLVREASRLGAPAATADAVRACIDELHDLHRLEMVRFYPIIARQLAGQQNAMDSFTKLRLTVAGESRKFLRVLENGLVRGLEGVIGAADVCFAGLLLEHYVADKRALLYPLDQRADPGVRAA